jgi:hypothetical protein
MGPLLILLAVAAVITILLIRMVPWTCFNSSASLTEGFTLPDVKNCPYGSVEYIDAHDVILCCDGKVEGKECLGKNICRFSPSADPAAPPHCTDYVASQAFVVDGSMIQNPDTNTCLSVTQNNNLIVMDPCSSTDKTQQWTYNKLGQIVQTISGKCVEQRTDYPAVKYYALAPCQLKDAQLFKYDYKTNTLYNASSPESALYAQDNMLNKEEKFKYIFTSQTDQELKAILKKSTGTEASQKDLDNIKGIYYTDVGKPQRSTFISVKPTIQEAISGFASMLKNIGTKKV